MNLDVLNQPLEVHENPGLETTDPRLDEIATCAQQARYAEAAAKAEEVLSSGTYDIRVVGSFFYGVFLEQDIAGMKGIFEAIEETLRNNWDAFGPVERKEKHAQTSLRWFFGQLVKILQYEESRKSEVWNRWIAGTTSEQVQEDLDAADELLHTLNQVLEEAAGPVADGLMKTIKWLRSFQNLVVPSEPEEAAPEAEAEPQTEAMEESEEPHDEEGQPEEEIHETQPTPPPDHLSPPSSSSPPLREDTIEIENTYPLRLLLKKMEAFDRLISEEKFPRAALVADDINDTIASFDPRVYFPKLFARFSLLQAMHIGELASYEDHKQTVEWHALKEFYKVDLEGFIEF